MATKVPFLFSYHYVRQQKPEFLDWVLHNPNVEVLIDSGAFSAFNAGAVIDLAEYIAFVKKWEKRLFGYVSLDVIGDPAASDANHERMLDAGLRPIPVHVRGMDGEDMDRLFEVSPWVALGGFRRPKRGPCPPSYVTLKMKWARGRDVHWLGYTNLKRLHQFKPFSCDCSSWASSHQFGQAQAYLGGRSLCSVVDRPTAVAGKAPEWFIRHVHELGFSRADVANDGLWARNVRHGVPFTRHLPMQVSAAAWVRYVLDMRERIGTRIFIATPFASWELPTLYHWTDHFLGTQYPNPVWDAAVQSERGVR